MSNLPYRPCVGMMVFNAQGKIFAGKRLDQTVEAWQMPQGGIDPGENPRVAAFRELKEEIGTDRVEIAAEHPDWLNYDLPEHLIGVALHGKYRGQTQKWFAMKFLGTDRDIDLATPHQEFSEWRWLKTDQLNALVVPFKREIYASVFGEFREFVK